MSSQAPPDQPSPSTSISMRPPTTRSLQATTPGPSPPVLAVSPAPALWAFASFGALWGTWGGALPRIRDQAGLDDGQVGIALVFVALGAIPAMALTGTAVDRWGARVAAVAVLALSGAGVVVALTAAGLVSLAIGLTLLGAASGTSDVAINAAALAVERTTGKSVLITAHATFSAAVVVASLAAGAVTVTGLPVPMVFAAVVAVAAVAAARLWKGGPTVAPSAASRKAARGPVPLPSRRGPPRGGRVTPRLLAASLVAALALAVENAHQSWGAIYLADVLGVHPGVTALAPALFAGVSAVTRWSVGRWWQRHLPDAAWMVAGGLIAATGSTLLATADTLAAALIAVVVTAAGTSVLFPTLLRAVTADVEEGRRGTATSTVASTAYLGFLLGPVYVGHLADHAGLRVGMLGVAVLAALFTALSVAVLRRRGS